jgi:hypothetical protein
LVSSIPPPVVADEPLLPLVALAPEPELAALEPVVEEPMDEPPFVPPFVPPGAFGFAAPISPAAVPGPARPALSVSAGEPVAANALATATDMQPATNAIMSFFICDLPVKD